MPDTMITTAEAPTALPLKTLLRNYRSAFKAWGAALTGDYDRDMTEEESSAYQNAAAALCMVAIDAMIEAPVVSLVDVAAKLRFLFEVVADCDAGVDPDSWEGRIINNILRDVDTAPLSDRRSSMIDPVLALWKRVMATGAEYCRVVNAGAPKTNRTRLNGK